MKSRYNIIWITLDSVKASAMPTHGNPYVSAPNAQRLAKQGMTFDNAFAQMPKCMPSRPSQLTGRYPHVDGLRTILGKDPKEFETSGFVVEQGMPNLITELKRHGYATCHKGVNHLLSWELYNSDLMDSTTDWKRWDQCEKAQGTCTEPHLLRAQYSGDLPASFNQENHTDAEATRQFCEFLNEPDRSESPFFGYLDLRAPHPYYVHWPEFKGLYENLDIPAPAKRPLNEVPFTEQIYRRSYDLESMTDAEWSQIIKAYYSAISYNDMLVGRVLDTLEQQGLSENTIVIYTSDHGDFAGDHGCTEKHDPFLYDSLLHLPLIVSLPQSTPSGSRYNGLVEMLDITPTLMDYCLGEVPEWVQGKSLKPVIDDPRQRHKEAVFAQGGVEESAIDRMYAQGERHFTEKNGRPITTKQSVGFAHPDFMKRAKMIRTKTHKYIHRLNGHHELYDLTKDPGELYNQIDNPEYLGYVTELRTQLVDWMIESETNLPRIEKLIL